MYYKQIVNRLTDLRVKKNLTARELGKRLGNSDTYVYKVEDCTIVLSVPKFLEILKILDVSIEEFFLGEECIDEKNIIQENDINSNKIDVSKVEDEFLDDLSNNDGATKNDSVGTQALEKLNRVNEEILELIQLFKQQGE